MSLLGGTRVIGVVAIVALLFSGCTAVDKIGARVNEQGQLEFAVCESLQVNRIEVRQERAAFDEPVTELWVATGDYALSNDHLRFGVPPDGMTNEAGPATVLPASIVFYAERDDADGAVQDVLQATFAMGDLTSSQWRMADGRVLDAPPC